MFDATAPKQYPVVLRFESMTPSMLARYRLHLERSGGKLDHVDKSRTHLNYRFIGTDTWFEDALDEIEDMKTENFEKELAELKRQNRKTQRTRREIEGPRDPWRASKYGPMREVILTAHHDFFADDLDTFLESGEMSTLRSKEENAREKEFVARGKDWLQTHFPGDVIEAHVDRDEHTIHIHAVILPRVEITIRRKKEGISVTYGTRRMLQPSKHPLIRNYEKAQDSVGDWFSGLGLVRGERRKQAWRDAIEAGVEPEGKVHHKRTSQWRQEQDIALAQKTAESERRTKELDTRAVELNARAAELDAREARLAATATDLDARDTALSERSATVAETAAEAEAVLAVAAAIEAGSLTPDADGGLFACPDDSEAGRRLQKAEEVAPEASERTRSLFGRAFAKVSRMAQRSARVELEAKFSGTFEAISSTLRAIQDVEDIVPTSLRAGIRKARKALNKTFRGVLKAKAVDSTRVDFQEEKAARAGQNPPEPSDE